MSVSAAHLKAVKAQHRQWLLQQPGVTGAAIGADPEGNPCLKILTDKVPEGTKHAIRQRLPGVPVVFEETGEIRAT
jgi:hypothetical protein